MITRSARSRSVLDDTELRDRALAGGPPTDWPTDSGAYRVEMNANLTTKLYLACGQIWAGTATVVCVYLTPDAMFQNMEYKRYDGCWELLWNIFLLEKFNTWRSVDHLKNEIGCSGEILCWAPWVILFYGIWVITQGRTYHYFRYVLTFRKNPGITYRNTSIKIIFSYDIGQKNRKSIWEKTHVNPCMSVKEGVWCQQLFFWTVM